MCSPQIFTGQLSEFTTVILIGVHCFCVCDFVSYLLFKHQVILIVLDTCRAVSWSSSLRLYVFHGLTQVLWIILCYVWNCISVVLSLYIDKSETAFQLFQFSTLYNLCTSVWEVGALRRNIFGLRADRLENRERDTAYWFITLYILYSHLYGLWTLTLGCWWYFYYLSCLGRSPKTSIIGKIP